MAPLELALVTIFILVILRALMIRMKIWILRVVRDGDDFAVSIGPWGKRLELEEAEEDAVTGYAFIMDLGPLIYRPISVERGESYLAVTLFGVDYFFNIDEVDLRGLTYDGWGMEGDWGLRTLLWVNLMQLVTGRYHSPSE